MNKKIVGPLICSFIVGGFAILFHLLNVTPNNWNAFFMWLPFYISPIWGVAGISWLSERRKK